MIQKQPGDRQDRRHRIAGHLEAARQVGRGAAQHHHADRDDEERDQRADARHLGEEVDRHAARPAARSTTATMIVCGTGVSVRGFTLWNSGGTIPSRPIANRMRVWP